MKKKAGQDSDVLTNIPSVELSVIQPAALTELLASDLPAR
jgi:hypothetical protein